MYLHTFPHSINATFTQGSSLAAPMALLHAFLFLVLFKVSSLNALNWMCTDYRLLPKLHSFFFNISSSHSQMTYYFYIQWAFYLRNIVKFYLYLCLHLMVLQPKRTQSKTSLPLEHKISETATFFQHDIVINIHLTAYGTCSAQTNLSHYITANTLLPFLYTPCFYVYFQSHDTLRSQSNSQYNLHMDSTTMVQFLGRKKEFSS